MLRGAGKPVTEGSKDAGQNLLAPAPASTPSSDASTNSSSSGSIMDQRRANAQRSDNTRVGRE